MVKRRQKQNVGLQSEKTVMHNTSDSFKQKPHSRYIIITTIVTFVITNTARK